MTEQQPAQIGRYLILGEVGRGGMGAVYRARDLVLEREVAIKLLNPTLTRDPQANARFRREANLAARLRHPNIVTIYDLDEDDGRFFIVMELLAGVSMAEVLHELHHLPLAEAIPMLEQVAYALNYAHRQGVIHRDIKPANIVLTSESQAVLTDFGLAKSYSEADTALTMVTMPGTVFGTPQYIAPEQIEGQAVDGRADIYALAVVGYEMLTGFCPFNGTISNIIKGHLTEAPPLPSEYNPLLPPAVEAVILKGLAKAPADRYQSAADFQQALRAAYLPPTLEAHSTVSASTNQLPQPTANADQPAAGELARIAAPAPRRRLVGIGGGLVAAVILLYLALNPISGTGQLAQNGTATPSVAILPLTFRPSGEPATEEPAQPSPPLPLPTVVPGAEVEEGWSSMQFGSSYTERAVAQTSEPMLTASLPADVRFNTPPVILNGSLYIVSDANGATQGGNLFVLNSQSLKNRARLNHDPQGSGVQLIGPPTLLKDGGLAVRGGNNAIYFTTVTNPRDLTNVYYSTVPLTAAPVGDIYRDNRLYLPRRDGVLLALNAATLAPVWSFTATAGISLTIPPLVGENAIYLADSAGILHKLDPDDGSEVWNQVNGSPISSPLLLVGNYIFYVTRDSVAHAVVDKGERANVGDEGWTNEYDLPHPNDGSAVVISQAAATYDGVVYFPASNGAIYAFDFSTGRYLYHVPATPPTCVDPPTSQPNQPTPEPPAALYFYTHPPLTVSNTLLLISDGGGCLVAFDRNRLEDVADQPGRHTLALIDRWPGEYGGLSLGANYLYVSGAGIMAFPLKPLATPEPTTPGSGTPFIPTPTAAPATPGTATPTRTPGG